MRISDWSSDVALPICQQSHQRSRLGLSPLSAAHFRGRSGGETMSVHAPGTRWYNAVWRWHFYAGLFCIPFVIWLALTGTIYTRSEEHTSELQSLMRISYAVFCLKKKTQQTTD